MRTAFEGLQLVRIDCRGLQPSDYKKIGAKLKVGIHFYWEGLNQESRCNIGILSSVSSTTGTGALRVAIIRR